MNGELTKITLTHLKVLKSNLKVLKSKDLKKKLTDSISAIDDFGDQWISRDLKVQWSSREQLATINCFETVRYQIGQWNAAHGSFVSMSIMVPVLVYTRPFCYYELIFYFILF
jgi:hypothetical protein